MILKFLNKVPAGLMVIPLFLGALINTLFPEALKIGGLTTALFSSAGINTLLGLQLFCLGSALLVSDMSKVLKRGSMLLISKFAIGALLGIIVGRLFGPMGVLGLTPLAIISAVTSSNGSIYLTLMSNYGDEADAGCFPILAINGGPFLTMLALGTSGLAKIPLMALIATMLPVIIGMILGNLDKGFRDLIAPMGTAIIPVIGFALGTGINLTNVVKGGFPGILLGLTTIFIGGAFVLIFDKLLFKRPGYAAWAVATTSGNAIGIPVAAALADPALEAVAASATVQVAASTVLSAILVPFIVNYWAKKYGCPKMPLTGQKFD